MVSFHAELAFEPRYRLNLKFAKASDEGWDGGELNYGVHGCYICGVWVFNTRMYGCSLWCMGFMKKCTGV